MQANIPNKKLFVVSLMYLPDVDKNNMLPYVAKLRGSCKVCADKTQLQTRIMSQTELPGSVRMTKDKKFHLSTFMTEFSSP